MRNQKGLTLLEIMVGLVLFSIAGYAIMVTFSNTQGNIVRVREELKKNTDALLAENSMFVDFKNIDPSFNYMKVDDDQGRNFFDFFPDVPEQFLQNKSRTLTLSASGKKEFFFLQVDAWGGGTLVYDPVSAYDVGPTPKSFEVPATLTFNSLNKNNIISTQRPEFWKDGRLLLLDTPARVRALSSSGVDLRVAPRSPAFIGKVSGGTLSLDPTIGPLFRTDHPETGAPISSADTFLRTIPTMGGGLTFVRIRPVRLIKYSFEEQKDWQPKSGKAYKLYKHVYENGTYKPPFLISDRLKSVTFERSTVTQKIIRFSLQKME